MSNNPITTSSPTLRNGNTMLAMVALAVSMVLMAQLSVCQADIVMPWNTNFGDDDNAMETEGIYFESQVPVGRSLIEVGAYLAKKHSITLGLVTTTLSMVRAFDLGSLDVVKNQLRVWMGYLSWIISMHVAYLIDPFMKRIPIIKSIRWFIVRFSLSGFGRFLAIIGWITMSSSFVLLPIWSAKSVIFQMGKLGVLKTVAALLPSMLLLFSGWHYVLKNAKAQIKMNYEGEQALPNPEKTRDFPSSAKPNDGLWAWLHSDSWLAFVVNILFFVPVVSGLAMALITTIGGI